MASRKPTAGISLESFEKYSYSHLSLISHLLDEAEKSKAAAAARPTIAKRSESVEDKTVTPSKPSRELFTEEEHRQYLGLLLHSKANPRLFPPTAGNRRVQNLDEDQKKQILVLHSKVVAAQKKFLKESEESVSKQTLFKLSREQRQFTKECYKTYYERCLKYKCLYQMMDNVTLTVELPTERHTTFDYIDTYLEMGTVPYLILPKFDQRYSIPQELKKIQGRYPIVKPQNSKGVPFKQLISQDGVADEVARKYGAQIVVSLSTLKTLFANSHLCLENGWVVPIIVRDNLNQADGHSAQKIVYMDKAFHARDDSIVTEYLAYQKRAMKLVLLHPKHAKAHRFTRVKPEQLKDTLAVDVTERVLPASKSDVMSNDPTKSAFVGQDFGHCNSAELGGNDEGSETDEDKLVIDDEMDDDDRASSKQTNQETEFETEKTVPDHDILKELYAVTQKESNTEESTSVIETFHSRERKRKHADEKSNDVPSTSKMPLIGGPQKIENRFTSPENSPPSAISRKQLDILGDIVHETDQIIDESALLNVNESDYVQPGDNVTYQLWKLGDLKVMVRCSVDGSTVVDKKAVFWKIHPKLEYRPHIGGEVVTYTECAKQWIATTVRPKCKCARVRINAFSHMVIGVQELTSADIVEPSTEFNQWDCLDLLSTTLQKLYSLSEGNYLLSHDCGETVYKILKGISNDGSSSKTCKDTYDLHAVVKATTCAIHNRKITEVIPWHPIDSTIMLFPHLRKNRIPVIGVREKSTVPVF